MRSEWTNQPSLAKPIVTTTRLFALALPFAFLIGLVASESDDPMIKITENLRNDGEYELDSYFVAKKSDYEACLDWRPTDEEQHLPLKDIINLALKYVTPPEPNPDYQYRPPELRGVDLRHMGHPHSLWYWEIYLGFNIDHESTKDVIVRDGEVLKSVQLLPNGGLIHLRPATVEEQEEFEKRARKRAKVSSDPFKAEPTSEQSSAEQSATSPDPTPCSDETSNQESNTPVR